MSLHGSQIVVVEAGARPRVAGRPDLVDTDEQSVTVAVHRDGPDVLSVAGGVALAPVLATAARPEGHPPRRQRAMKCLVVHPADHEHLSAVVLLHDSTYEAIDVALQPPDHIGGQGGLRRGRARGGGHVDILPCNPPVRTHEIHQCWMLGC